jgi:hypothetical protein
MTVQSALLLVLVAPLVLGVMVECVLEVGELLASGR